MSKPETAQRTPACHMCQEWCDCDRCKLQRAAPRMLEALSKLAAWDQSADDVRLISEACSEARAILREVEG